MDYFGLVTCAGALSVALTSQPVPVGTTRLLGALSHGRLTAKFRLSSTPCFGLNNQSSSSSMTYDFGCYMAAIILGRPIGTVAIGEIRARILSTNAGCIAVTGGALF